MNLVSPFWALAQSQAGEWRVEDNDGDIQVSYSDKAIADPVLIFSCDYLNAALSGVYRSRASAAAVKSGTLTLQFTGAQSKAAIPIHRTLAPGEEAVGFETPFTSDLAAVLAEKELVIELENLRIGVDASGADALSKLISSCPEAPALSAGDMNQYRTYVHRTDGFSVDIPTRLFRLVNTDRNGRSYRTDTGNATLTILDFINALDQGVNGAYTRALADRKIVATPSYKAKGENFFVISGKTKNRIVYYKQLLTCDGSKWISLRIEYDYTSRGFFDSIVTRVSQSFAPRLDADGTALCE